MVLIIIFTVLKYKTNNIIVSAEVRDKRKKFFLVIAGLLKYKTSAIKCLNLTVILVIILQYFDTRIFTGEFFIRKELVKSNFIKIGSSLIKHLL